MKWTDIKDNWAAFSAPILQRWPQMEENRLIEIAGDRALFTAEVAKTESVTVDEARESVLTWLDSSMPADVMMDPHHDNASISSSAASIPDGETPLDDDAAFGDDDKLENPVGRT